MDRDRLVFKIGSEQEPGFDLALDAAQSKIQAWAERVGELSKNRFESGKDLNLLKWLEPIVKRSAEASGYSDKITAGLTKAVSIGGKLAGALGAVVTITKAAYENILSMTERFYGFHEAMEKSIQTERQVAAMRVQHAQRDIQNAQQLNTLEEKRAALRTSYNRSLEVVGMTNSNLLEAQRASKPGFFGQWADGRNNNELEYDVEKAQAAFDGASLAAKTLEQALLDVDRVSEQAFKGFVKQFQREAMSDWEREVSILREQGLTEERAKEVAGFRRQNRDKATTASMKESMGDELFRLENGDAAAANKRFEDSIKDLTLAQQMELRVLRQKIEALKEANKLKEEQAKANQEEERQEERLAALRESQGDLADRERQRVQQQAEATDQLVERLKELRAARDAVLGGFSSLEGLGSRIANEASQSPDDKISKDILDVQKRIKKVNEDALEEQKKIARDAAKIAAEIHKVGGMR